MGTCSMRFLPFQTFPRFKGGGMAVPIQKAAGQSSICRGQVIGDHESRRGFSEVGQDSVWRAG